MGNQHIRPQVKATATPMKWRENGHFYQFRPATPADRKAIIDNINTICAEIIYLPSNWYVPTYAWETILSGSEINGTQQLIAVVEVNEQVVGHGRLFLEGFGHKNRHVIDVGLALLEPHRNMGIGSALLSYLIDWAKTAGYKKMTATILSNNMRARELFDQHGFKHEGLRVQQFKIGAEYLDEVLVARFL